MVLMRPIALDDQFVYVIDYMLFFSFLFSNRALTGFFRKSIQEQVVELLVNQVEEFHVEEQIVVLLVKYVEEVHVEEQAVVLLVEQVEEV